MSRPLKVMLVAAEASGDALGAGLARALKARLGKDVVFVSSTDTQYYRVPDAAAEFCRLTGLPEN